MADFNALFKSVIDRHKNNPIWDTGHFSDIKRISNTKVGTVGQEFIESACNELGISYSLPMNEQTQRASKRSPWDIKIHNIEFELKTATEDTGGKFQFNHIRYHRSYHALLCLGVSPDNLYFNLWSKADVVTDRAGKLVSMEKGANASYKLTKSKRELLDINSFAITLQNFADGFRF